MEANLKEYINVCREFDEAEMKQIVDGIYVGNEITDINQSQNNAIKSLLDGEMERYQLMDIYHDYSRMRGGGKKFGSSKMHGNKYYEASKELLRNATTSTLIKCDGTDFDNFMKNQIDIFIIDSILRSAEKAHEGQTPPGDYIVKSSYLEDLEQKKRGDRAHVQYNEQTYNDLKATMKTLEKETYTLAEAIYVCIYDAVVSAKSAEQSDPKAQEFFEFLIKKGPVEPIFTMNIENTDENKLRFINGLKHEIQQGKNMSYWSQKWKRNKMYMGFKYNNFKQGLSSSLSKVGTSLKAAKKRMGDAYKGAKKSIRKSSIGKRWKRGSDVDKAIGALITLLGVYESNGVRNVVDKLGITHLTDDDITYLEERFTSFVDNRLGSGKHKYATGRGSDSEGSSSSYNN